MPATDGMQEYPTIELKKGSGGTVYSAKSLLTYSWEPVNGKVEEDPEGKLVETWTKFRWFVDIEGIYEPSVTTSNEIDIKYLLDIFLPQGPKFFRESGWTGWTEVVLGNKKVKFKRTKDTAKLGTVEFTLKKETPLVIY